MQYIICQIFEHIVSILFLLPLLSALAFFLGFRPANSEKTIFVILFGSARGKTKKETENSLLPFLGFKPPSFPAFSFSILSTKEIKSLSCFGDICYCRQNYWMPSFSRSFSFFYCYSFSKNQIDSVPNQSENSRKRNKNFLALAKISLILKAKWQ